MQRRARCVGALGAVLLGLTLAACAGSPTAATTTTAPSGGTGTTGAAAPGGSTTTVSLPGGRSTTTSTTTTVRPACTLAVTSDPYDGFQIGTPLGWDVTTLNGMILVSNGPNAVEEEVVRPALVAGGLTPATLFSSSLATLRQEVLSGGGTFVSTPTGGGGLPTASLELRADGQTLEGRASVELLPEATAHGSSVAAFAAYWAPQSQFAAQQATLQQVADCYRPEHGTLFGIVEDQSFAYAIPLGWKAENEGQDTIEIADGNNASASYLLTLATPSEGVDSAATLLSWFLNQLGIHPTQVLSTIHQANQTTVTGALGEGFYEEFLGTLPDGRAAHALVSVQATTGGGNTSGVIRMGISTAALWNSVNSALVQIMGSIQHNFTQDLQEFERLSQQWQAFGQQVQGFDDALNGVDLVRDPATGGVFEAPYGAYDESGPDGPGYYDSSGNKLQVVTP